MIKENKGGKMTFARQSDLKSQGAALLTIRCPNVYVEYDVNARGTVVIDMPKNPEIITNTEERRLHVEQSDQSWFEEQVRQATKPYSHEPVTLEPVILADKEHPLEVVTGDVFPILETPQKRVFVNFLRDIPPQGWVIPGGCPQNLYEIMDPEAVGRRELTEELIILDKNNNVFCFSSFSQPVSERVCITLLHHYNIKCNHFINVQVRSLDPVYGLANKLRIVSRDNVLASIDKINVTVDPEVASLAITSYLGIRLPDNLTFDDIRILDGELLPDGRAINRTVRLMHKVFATSDPEPLKYFSGGIDLSTGYATSLTRVRAQFPL